MVWTRGRIAPALIAVSAALSACGGGGAGTTPTKQATATNQITGAWVGKVQGTDAFVALASNGHEVLAYVCDGKDISQWFHGVAGERYVNLGDGSVRFKQSGAKLDARLQTNVTTGTFTGVDGKRLDFTATRARGDAGLYRLEQTADGRKWVAGWVVLNDGKLRGARVSSTGAFEPETRLSPAAKRQDSGSRAY
jgi:hypothetical protein